jgi:hypothetical protein
LIVVSRHSAEVFASLQQAGEPLLLANAWDVASAVAVQAAGARAIPTTSAPALVAALDRHPHVEEYAHHNGHADLLRERVDGRTGYY